MTSDCTTDQRVLCVNSTLIRSTRELTQNETLSKRAHQTRGALVSLETLELSHALHEIYSVYYAAVSALQIFTYMLSLQNIISLYVCTIDRTNILPDFISMIE